MHLGGVDKGAGKIVGGVAFVGGASAPVGVAVAAERDGVAQACIGVLHV